MKQIKYPPKDVRQRTDSTRRGFAKVNFLLFVQSKGAGKLKDEECIRKFLAGEEQYFSVIVEHYRSEIFRYISSYIRDRQQCEDIVQDVFTDFVLLLRSGKYEESGRVKHLLVQMAHAHIKNYIKHECRHDALFTRLPDNFDSADDSGQEEKYNPQREKMIRLRAGLRGIKEVPRKIFMFRYHKRKSFEEIGKHFNMKPHTAMTIHARIMEKLRKVIAGNKQTRGLA